MKNLLLTILSVGLVTSYAYAQAPAEPAMTRADSLIGFNADSVIARANNAGIEQWEKDMYLHVSEEHFLAEKYHLSTARVGQPPSVTPMTPCTNMGFETGDFSGWTGFIGLNQTSSLGPLDSQTPGIFTGALNPAESDNTARHSIMSSAAPNAACGGFPVCPAGFGTYTCRLGNTYAQYQGEGIQQTFVVDAANTQFTYRYAVVLDDGGSHPPTEQPYFKISVLDSLGQPINACAQYYVTAGTNNVGFTQCTPGVYYRPWTTVSFDLSGFVNQSITIQFVAAGCIWSGHYAMAYIDASCSSIADAVTATFCPGSPGAFLVAPPGFGDYQWFYPNGSPIVGATNDSLFVPSATQGDTFSVEMHAIADTSCVTVLNVVIQLTLLQDAVVSTDPLCHNQPSGSATASCTNCIPPTTYQWNSSPPQVGATATGLPPGPYVVTVTDSIGCTDTMQVFLNNPPSDDTSAITYEFCYGDDQITLWALPGMPSYQWMSAGEVVIPGETNQWLVVPNPVLGDVYYCEYNTTPCPTLDSIVINYIPPVNVFTPDTLVNIFTPNNDQRNDFFYPFYSYTIEGQTGASGTPQYDFTTLYIGTFEIWIYNRWGQEIFYSNDYNVGWDGKIDGKEGDVGVYYYIARYTSRCFLDMEPITKTGFVHLQR